MPTSVLVTCPDYDRMTRYLSAWANLFIGEAQKRGHVVYVLKETDANQEKFHGMVKKNAPSIIFLNGHGAEDRVAGQDHKVIIDTRSASILKNAMVYAVSCKSARTLGAQAVKVGAKAYIGYTEDFILVSQPRKTAHPQDDTTAALFLNPSNQIVISLVKGHSAKEAVAKGRTEFAKSITSALNSDVQSDDDKYIPYLMWNRQFLAAC